MPLELTDHRLQPFHTCYIIKYGKCYVLQIEQAICIQCLFYSVLSLKNH